MKLSYKRIIITISFFLLFLILNLFIFKIDSYLFFTIFILFTLILLIYQVGYEKKYYYREKDIILNLLIYIIIYLIFTYLLGLFTGFTTNSYSLSIKGILFNIFPVLLFIVAGEILRYEVLRKSYPNRIILVLITIIFILLDLSIYINHFDFSSLSFLNILICVVIPSISKNIFLTYLVGKTHYRESLLYRIIMELRVFILPIYPDFGIYVDSIFNILFPACCFLLVYRFFNKKDIVKVRRYEKSFVFSFVYSFLLISSIIIILLNSGLFRYFSLSIGSNSMSPNINKGDVIIVEDINYVDNIKKGDVIIFKSSSKLISHRVFQIKDIDSVRYYYTKGDNNKSVDLYPVLDKDIVGVYKFRIRFLGYFSVKIREILKR